MKKTNEVSPRTAAQTLGITLHFVYQSLWDGKLPGRKVGRGWRIPVAAVEARLKQRSK